MAVTMTDAATWMVAAGAMSVYERIRQGDRLWHRGGISCRARCRRAGDAAASQQTIDEDAYDAGDHQNGDTEQDSGPAGTGHRTQIDPLPQRERHERYDDRLVRAEERPKVIVQVPQNRLRPRWVPLPTPSSI